jgi:hypothetical protein
MRGTIKSTQQESKLFVLTGTIFSIYVLCCGTRLSASKNVPSIPREKLLTTFFEVSRILSFVGICFYALVNLRNQTLLYGSYRDFTPRILLYESNIQ